MKFWEVWKEDNEAEESSDVDVTTISPHWPNPPAFWGESVMGRPKGKDMPLSSDSDATNGPIITKLDKIVDILRPMSDKKNDWLDSGSENIMHKIKPESRYDSPDASYDIDDKSGEKIGRRNLKKIIIEERFDDNSEVMPKKKKKKKRSKNKENIPTYIVEEELIPENEEVVEDEVEQNDQDVIYKIVKPPKPKPKPITKQIIIEDQNEEIEPEVTPKVVYQQMSPRREQPKDLVWVNENFIPYNNQVIYLTSTSTTTSTTTTTTTTPKPTAKKRKKKIKIKTQKEENIRKTTDDDEEYEYQEYDIDEDAPDEEAWGSASPETRVGMDPHRRQRLNPLNVLRRLRPPPRRSPPPPPHMGPNRLVPGGTFRMRFYMDANRDQHDYWGNNLFDISLYCYQIKQFLLKKYANLFILPSEIDLRANILISWQIPNMHSLDAIESKFNNLIFCISELEFSNNTNYESP